MDNIEMEKAFKSLNEFMEVEPPVELKEDAPTADTVMDLFINDASYNVIHNFDVNGMSCGIYAEATHDGDSCDAIFGEFKEENINGAIIDVMDAEGNLQGTLDSVGLDTKVTEVERLAKEMLTGESETEHPSIQKEIEEPTEENARDDEIKLHRADGDSSDDKVEIKYKDKKITISDNTALQESQRIDLSEPQELAKAKEVIDAKRNDEESVEQIVDVSAEAVDDLKKSYIGSAILRCPTCHTMIYKEVDDLNLSEEASTEDNKIYNADEECPHCGASDGYELVGQVASLDVDADGKPIEEPKPEETGDESTKEDDGEKEKSSPAHLDVGLSKDAVEESIDIESVSEEAFDKLITNYLKENYLNVKSYKTTSAAVDDETRTLTLEGVISFKSGKEKPTKFAFEAKGASKTGKVRFCGVNESFSSKKAYNLVAEVKDGELLSESLSYSYSIEGNKVAGRVRLPKKR